MHLSIYWNWCLHTYVLLNGSNGPQLESYGYDDVGNNSGLGFGLHPRTWRLRQNSHTLGILLSMYLSTCNKVQ
jgi:hypothetical protein